MKGKILSIITAILFGATMVAAPVVVAQTTGTDTEMTKPAKKHKKSKKSTKKATKKSKKKAAKPADTGA